jgi:hypothetical protein
MPSPAAAQYDRLDEQSPVIHNLFGEVGIFDMPSAHMAPDGELGLVVGTIGLTNRYNFAFQQGWFEGSFRYSYVAGLFPKETNFHDRSLSAKFRLHEETDEWPDISIGIRDLLGTGVYSSEYLVASKHFGPFDVTLGMGWGQLADRDIGPNPAGFVSNHFKVRNVTDIGSGGIPDANTFFTGRIGAFGGVVWQTPVKGLSFLAEYSPMKYQGYTWPGKIAMRSPVNFGLSYRPTNFFAVTGGWMYGSTYGLGITVNGNATRNYPDAMRIGPKVPPPAVRPDSQQQVALTVLTQSGRQTLATKAGGPWVQIPTPAERAKQDILQAFMSESRGVRGVEISGQSVVIDAHLTNNSAAQCSHYAKIASAVSSSLTTVAINDLEDPKGHVTFCSISTNKVADSSRADTSFALPAEALKAKIKKDLSAQAIELDVLFVGTSELWIYYENYKYYREAEAIGRVIRVLMADAPPSVEVFHIIATNIGIPRQEMTVVRSAMERQLLSSVTTPTGMGEALSLNPAPPSPAAYFNEVSKLYPRFGWSIDPKITEHLFDPDHPMQVMLYADAAASLLLGPGLTLSTELTGEIWSNYTYDRAAGSNLPHVRTDLLQYSKHGKYGIAALQLNYESRLAPGVYTKLKGGYLEDMFMGGGAEILWRPERSRFAFGANLYQVWQRDYDRLFGVRDYNVVTGHVSVYYETPWSGMNAAVHAGRYLAGDWGATFQLTRRFESGVEIGAWVTFTDVPFSEFGEGSFDKGLIIHIPFEWGLPIYSRSSYDLHLPSLTRDGGQRLANDDTLYNETLGTSYGQISEHLDDVVEP